MIQRLTNALEPSFTKGDYLFHTALVAQLETFTRRDIPKSSMYSAMRFYITLLCLSESFRDCSRPINPAAPSLSRMCGAIESISADAEWFEGSNLL